MKNVLGTLLIFLVLFGGCIAVIIASSAVFIHFGIIWGLVGLAVCLTLFSTAVLLVIERFS